MGDLVQTILAIMGKDVPVTSESQRVRPDASEVDRLCADISKAKKAFGWTPKFTLEDGLRETVSWFEANLEQYHPEIYTV